MSRRTASVIPCHAPRIVYGEVEPDQRIRQESEAFGHGVVTDSECVMQVKTNGQRKNEAQHCGPFRNGEVQQKKARTPEKRCGNLEHGGETLNLGLELHPKVNLPYPYTEQITPVFGTPTSHHRPAKMIPGFVKIIAPCWQIEPPLGEQGDGGGEYGRSNTQILADRGDRPQRIGSQWRPVGDV